MLELLVIVVIISVLSVIGYSSMMDLIFTNRAKETAHVLRTFAEKSIADAKRQGKPVKISLVSNDIIAYDANTDEEISRMALGGGFTGQNVPASPNEGASMLFNATGARSEFRLGVSGITEQGYFAACGARGYCGAAVKSANENSFRAYIKKGNDAIWEAL